MSNSLHGFIFFHMILTEMLFNILPSVFFLYVNALYSSNLKCMILNSLQIRPLIWVTYLYPVAYYKYLKG